MQGFYRPLGSLLFVIYVSLTLLLINGTGGERSVVGAQISPAPCVEGGMLVGLDGAVALYDTPENGIIRFTLPTGQIVQVLDEVQQRGERWCLIAPLNEAGMGWVPSTLLTALNIMPVRFGNFRFCEGSAAGPGRVCDQSLPRSAAGLWLRWEYSGLRPGDQVQRVLIIHQERYQTPLTVWSGAPYGQQLVNLLDHHPRPEPGTWTVQFFVNGILIQETQVEIR
ncbi:MAG: hypothetical protein H0T73_05970 [Ardenticatenales bacterium]|nr:hypothetical protein [Ardenticatenales bacterium]